MATTSHLGRASVLDVVAACMAIVSSLICCALLGGIELLGVSDPYAYGLGWVARALSMFAVVSVVASVFLRHSPISGSRRALHALALLLSLLSVLLAWSLMF